MQTSNTGKTQRGSHQKSSEVPPLRDLGVVLHQPIVHIHVLAIVGLASTLLPSDGGPHILEAGRYLVPVKERNVDQRGSVEAEKGAVDNGIRSSDVRGRVRHVLLLVEQTLVVDRHGHVVKLSKVIEDTV